MTPPLLSEAEITTRLAGSPWRREGEQITRELTFADFDAAVAFVNRLAGVAQAMNHHPDILIHGYNRVRLTSSSHDAGGLTAVDFDLAARCEELVEGDSATDASR